MTSRLRLSVVKADASTSSPQNIVSSSADEMVDAIAAVDAAEVVDAVAVVDAEVVDAVAVVDAEVVDAVEERNSVGVP